jgi:hypothetical protein
MSDRQSTPPDVGTQQGPGRVVDGGRADDPAAGVVCGDALAKTRSARLEGLAKAEPSKRIDRLRVRRELAQGK